MAIPNYQYEPLTPPSSWSAEEKRFAQRLTDILDDIYLKYGRLDEKHLSASYTKRVSDAISLSVGAVLEPVATLPSEPTVGQTVFYTGVEPNEALQWTGTEWIRLNNSVIGSNVEITPDYVRIQSDRFSVGNETDPENDALVIEDGAVSAPIIESPSVMPAYSGPTTITIIPTATEAEIEAGTAFQTLAQLATVLNGRWLPSNVTVTVDASIDEYDDIVFNMISGANLTIVGAGTYTGPSDSMPRHTGLFYIQDCASKIMIQNMRIQNALSATQTIHVYVSRCTFIEFTWCVIEDSGAVGGTLVRSDQGASVYLNSCAFVNCTGVSATACTVRYGGRITVANAIGDLSASTVLMDVWSGAICWNGTAPVCANATVATNTTIGTAAYSLGTRTPFRGVQGAGEGAPVSVDLSPTLARAYLTKVGWGSALYQGCTSSKGQCTTCYWFDVSSLAGKTIVSASLTLHRYSGYGVKAGVPVRLYPINNAAASGAVSRGTYIGQIGTIAQGATREMAIATTVVDGLVAGTYKGLGLYTGETTYSSERLYSDYYGRWYGGAVLSVTYQ